MIVFNLSCSQEHKFDGWFRSAEDFERQAAGGLVECPICGDSHITKQLSAPRINSGATEIALNQSRLPPGPQEVMAASLMPGLQEHMLQQFKSFVRSNTENVGNAFAETARKMHYGEESHRNIRGRVSRDEAIELQDEGIETMQLPPGLMLDEGVQ
ncbi:MAG: DUF1178 family protein [Betaproteobacteria bacterium]